MRKLNVRWSLIAGSIGLAVTIQPLAAEELSVLDCQGLPRAVKNVDENSKSGVEVRAINAEGIPADDGTFTLVRGGTTLTAEVQNGRAMFKEVAPGTWNLCPEADTKAEVSQINIIGNTTESDMTTVAVVGGGVLAAGGTVLGLMGSGSSGDDDSSEALSGVGNGSPQLTETELPSSTTGSSKRPGAQRPSEQAAEGDCLTEDEPDPISASS